VVGQASYAIVKGGFPKQKIAILEGFDYVNLGAVDDENYTIVNKVLVRKDKAPQEVPHEEPELELAHFIRDKVRERIVEADITQHSDLRVMSRIDAMGAEDLTNLERSTIKGNLQKVIDTNFPNQAFAIMLGQFRPNPKSDLYFDGHYRMIDERGNDSTGDQFWVIVRDNVVTTFLLRKSVQTRDSNYNNDKLRTDHSIKNINNFLKNRQQGGGKRAQRRAAKMGR
jgi:hypothetical protein